MKGEDGRPVPNLYDSVHIREDDGVRCLFDHCLGKPGLYLRSHLADRLGRTRYVDLPRRIVWRSGVMRGAWAAGADHQGAL
jgi:hypothetical protein